jgi:RNase H-fold protein (predicted Holliday junction resolvase)
MCEKALDLFEQMPIKSDDVTYSIIFNACAQLKNDRGQKVGKKLLEEISNKSLTNTIILGSAINMLMRFGDVTQAEKFFQMIKKKNLVICGIMMTGKCNYSL